MTAMKTYRLYFWLGLALLLVGGMLLLSGSILDGTDRIKALSAPTQSQTVGATTEPVVEQALDAELQFDASLPWVESSSPLTETLEPVATPAEDVSCDPSLGMEWQMCARGWSVERLSPLKGRMLVGLYGTPMGRGLGILGTASPTATVTMAREQAAAYQALLTDTVVVPFFHMVTTIADAYPGGDGDYNHRVITPTIQLWIDVARAHGLLVVLDIQPAHSPLTAELAYVAPFVRQRGVHLAIDPEFMMPAGAIPGDRLGLMDGDSINSAQMWLSERAWEAGERKLLIIHQFDDRMISGKDRLKSYRLVELIWDADGFGGPPAKIADHLQYAAEPGFEYGGFKLFYDYDTPLMTPAEVLRLDPRPVFVVYQ